MFYCVKRFCRIWSIFVIAGNDNPIRKIMKRKTASMITINTINTFYDNNIILNTF